MTCRVYVNAFYFSPLGIRAFRSMNKNFYFTFVSKRNQLIFTEKLANITSFLFHLFFWLYFNRKWFNFYSLFCRSCILSGTYCILHSDNHLTVMFQAESLVSFNIAPMFLHVDWRILNRNWFAYTVLTKRQQPFYLTSKPHASKPRFDSSTKGVGLFTLPRHHQIRGHFDVI